MPDLRFALRQLIKSPGFTAIAIVSLAFAIGVNSGVFAIANAMFFRPLRPAQTEEVVNVFTGREGANRSYRAFSYEEFSLLRDSGEVFADVGAFDLTTVGLAKPEGAEMQRKSGTVVSASYFSTLGVRPAAGRFFQPAETEPNANIPVAVVSHALWNRLEGDDDFASRTVSINGEPWNIIGVAPESFQGGNALLATDIWLPLGMASRLSQANGRNSDRADLANPENHSLYVMGRLQPGLKINGANSRLPVLAARLNAIATDTDQGTRTLEMAPVSRFNISTEPSSDGPLLLFGGLLLGMSGVVLLVACLNLTNMFLARGTARAHELAIRLALGASRWRVVRLLLIEGALVALIGGAAGLLLSSWANGLLVDSLARSSLFSGLGFSLALQVAPDLRVVLATLAFCAVATLLFSVGPALRITRGDARGELSLRSSGRTATDRWGHLFSARHCLLMAQVALSLALLFSAGLFFRAAHAAVRLDPGFQPEGDLVAELDYSLADRNETDVLAAVSTITDAMRADPAVRAVALASHIPFGNVNDGFDFSVAGGSDEGQRRVRGTFTAVSADYFDTLGVPLLRGRDFTAREWLDPQAPPVVIIDERTAATLFPDQDPLGQYVERTRRPDQAAAEPMEVIGIVAAHWNAVLADDPPPRAFFPLARRLPRHLFVHLRGQTADAVASGTLADRVRRELTRLDPDIPLMRLVPYPAIIDNNIELWTVRFAATLFGAFGGIALLLAVVGVYGVKAFAVARRTREFGIRAALGARPQQVQTLLMKQGAAQIAVGLSVGSLLALGAGQVLASMLLRVSSFDPLVLVAAALPLAITALLATWLPARRATKINPVEALRAE